MNINIEDNILQTAAADGMDAFVDAVMNAINDAIGNTLNAETMAMLNADQITLLAYGILREEMMDGGFVQLIHNGYGAFIFKNPFARAVKEWGIGDLGKLISKAHKYYSKYHEKIEAEMSDEEFMALFEQCPEFDELDDTFVIEEEKFTSMVACYIDDHLDNFVHVID